jgi:hypothetical protein
LAPPARACPVVTLFAAAGGRAVLVALSVMEQRYHAERLFTRCLDGLVLITEWDW